MFNIGISEMLVIAIIAIVFVGPERLPEYIRKIGKVVRQVKKSMNEVKYGLYNEIDKDDTLKDLQGMIKKTKQDLYTANWQEQIQPNKKKEPEKAESVEKTDSIPK